MKQPTIIEVFNDDGSHSHWTLIETETGEKIWSENPTECKSQGYPVSHQSTPAKIDLEELRGDFVQWAWGGKRTADQIFNFFSPFLSNNTEELQREKLKYENEINGVLHKSCKDECQKDKLTFNTEGEMIKTECNSNECIKGENFLKTQEYLMNGLRNKLMENTIAYGDSLKNCKLEIFDLTARLKECEMEKESKDKELNKLKQNCTCNCYRDFI